MSKLAPVGVRDSSGENAGCRLPACARCRRSCSRALLRSASAVPLFRSLDARERQECVQPLDWSLVLEAAPAAAVTSAVLLAAVRRTWSLTAAGLVFSPWKLPQQRLYPPQCLLSRSAQAAWLTAAGLVSSPLKLPQQRLYLNKFPQVALAATGVLCF